MLRAFLLLLLSFSALAETPAPSCEQRFADTTRQQAGPRPPVALDQPEVRELPAQEVTHDVLDRVRRGTEHFSYVVDDQGRMFAVSGDLPYTPGRLQLALVRDGQGRQTLVTVHESGTITYDNAARRFVFRSGYGLDLSEAERETLLAGVRRQHPGLAIGHADAPGAMASRVLSCADILAGQLNGASFQLDRIVTRHVMSFSMLGLKDFDIRRRHRHDPEAREAAERRLFLVFGVDAFRRTGTTYAGGLVGRALVEHQAPYALNYLGRMGTSITTNWIAKRATDQVEPALREWQERGRPPRRERGQGLSPEDTHNIMLYNNGMTVISPPIGNHFDHRVLETAPLNYYDACREGRPLRFLVSPRMMRVYESGIMTILGLPKYFLWGV